MNKLRIIPLGGLGEIGRNMMVMEWEKSIIIIDCGLMFPADYMLGVDYVIPDISYLMDKKDKIEAIIITHGHEDHTGALPFVLKEIRKPIYATALTIGLIKGKLREYGLDKDVVFNTVKPREKVRLGPFHIEFIRVSHSIVDVVGLAITTPAGVIIHSGDFKFDPTPIDGEVTDFNKFAEYGEKGVLALLSDSTNVEKEGFTISEKEVGVAFEEIFHKSTGRMIVATFSSNIHRIQQVINVAEAFGRKIILNGRSMVTNIRIAKELGYLNLPAGILVDIKNMDKLSCEEMVFLTTGSQGEPMSALTRIAMNDHKQIKIQKGDTIILSSKFIPGHEKAINTLINHLYRRGAEVIYEKVSEIHVSGHASQEELKLMINLVKPRFFIPIHGEYRHLVMHSKLARSLGIAEDRVIVAEDGDVVEMDNQGAEIVDKVNAGKVFVDGKGVGDVGDVVLKDRMHLSQDGIVVVLIIINDETGEIIYGPDIISRGFVFEGDGEDEGILKEAKGIAIKILERINIEAKTDTFEAKAEVRKALRRYFNKMIKRRPVIFPLIIEI
ncbi:MAG: ribonuclease J [Thermodesulfobacteriota bacterium]